MNFFNSARIHVLGKGEGEDWKRDETQSYHWSGAAKKLTVEEVVCKLRVNFFTWAVYSGVLVSGSVEDKV